MNGRSPPFLFALVVLGFLFPAVMGPGAFRAAAGEPAASAAGKGGSKKDKEGSPAKEARAGDEESGSRACDPDEVPVIGSCTDGLADALEAFLATASPSPATSAAPEAHAFRAELSSATYAPAPDAGKAAPPTTFAGTGPPADLVLQQATYSSSPACRRLPHRRDLRYLVVTVPDPVASGLRSFYDGAMDAVVSAATSLGYKPDRYFSPWDASSAADGADSTSAAAEACAARMPGLMLFRPGGDGSPKATQPLVVLVVGETPTWGVQRAALLRAVDMIAQTERTGKSDGPVAIPVLGPTFSGSIPSLREAIRTATQAHLPKPATAGTPAPAPFHFRIISGSATAATNKDELGLADEVDYSAVPVDDEELQNTFYKYLLDRACITAEDGRLRHVALLAEEGTTYGAAAGKPAHDVAASKKPASSATPNPYGPEWLATFPLHVGSLRAQYQQAPRGGAAGPSFVPPTSLDPKFDDPTRRLDVLPVLSPSTTVIEDLTLSREIDALSDRGIRFIGIAATDPADTVFLTQYIRQRRPDVRLFILDADILYTHPSLVGATRGALMVAPYPLTPSLSSWSFPLGGSWGGDGVVLTNAANEGTYRAAVALLGASTPQASGQVWISAVGNAGAWPVDMRQVRPDAAGERPAGPLFKSHPAPVAPSRTVFVLLILGFCLWQIGGILVALRHGATYERSSWPTLLRPFRAFAILGRASVERTCLAAFAVGTIDAIALPVAWLHRPFSFGGYALYDMGIFQWMVGGAGLAAFALGSVWAAYLLVAGMPREEPAKRGAILVAWAGPPICIALCLYALMQGPSDAGRILTILRAVAVSSTVSALTPMLLLAGVFNLFAWLHLERTRLGDRLPAETRRPWKTGVVAAAALLTLAALLVLFESKPLSTLEGPFGDGLFTTLFTLAAVVVTSSFAWLVALWMELHTFLKSVAHDYDGPHIEAAMRRLPAGLSAGPTTPLAPTPEERDETRALTAMADWLQDNHAAITKWPGGQTFRTEARQTITQVCATVFPPEKEAPGAASRKSLDATREVADGIRPLLETLWKEPRSRWPRRQRDADAAAWLDKAEELVAAHMAVRIHPMVSQIRALLALAVCSTLLWAFALGSYVFEPERLLTTIVSITLIALLLTALVMFVELERNPFMSALAKTKAEITWHTFLSDTITWVVLPFLAFLAVQYPAAANQIASWLQPAMQAMP